MLNDFQTSQRRLDRRRMSIPWGPVHSADPFRGGGGGVGSGGADRHVIIVMDCLRSYEEVGSRPTFSPLPFGKIPFYSPAMTDQVRASEPPRPGESATTAETAPRRRGGLLRTRTFGRWTARLLSLLGIALIILGLTGWWLDDAVLDDEGFGDVVAKSVQQQAVRTTSGTRPRCSSPGPTN